MTSVPPATADSATQDTPGPTTVAPAGTASSTPSTPTDSRDRWPTTVSGRKVLDQSGDTYLMKVFSSWGMAQNLTDAEITQALEAVAGAASTPSTSPRTASASRTHG